MCTHHCGRGLERYNSDIVDENHSEEGNISSPMNFRLQFSILVTVRVGARKSLVMLYHIPVILFGIGDRSSIVCFWIRCHSVKRRLGRIDLVQ
jgi:hypothetical protein